MTESRPALLVMDVEPAVVDRFDGKGGPELLERLAQAIGAARGAGVRVIYVRVAFREGHPEISARNRTFAAVSDAGGLIESDAATQVHPAVAPQPGDLIAIKKRISAFAGSDLDLLLRASGIDTLVLTGVSTSGVVLSTIREAADRDFGLVVLADGCLDDDPEVHRVLTEKVFPRQADVMTVEEWVAELEIAG